MELQSIQHIFFIGIGGTGMSALALFCKGTGKVVTGSDRYFDNSGNLAIHAQLQNAGIQCHKQDGNAITPEIDLVVASTAVEESNIEIQKARQLGIPIIKRAELLAMISNNYKTIAIAGTSGKSTTTAMVYHILQTCGYNPSLITGAGLLSLKSGTNAGNYKVGNGEYLVIEADESDGSLVKYSPEIGVILNIEKDHKEIDELMNIFSTFSQNTKKTVLLNANDHRCLQLKNKKSSSFGTKQNSRFRGEKFQQHNSSITFYIDNIPFEIPVLGMHNFENALAAVATCFECGLSLSNCASALKSFQGIERRMQFVGTKNGITIFDDYAHNPSKIKAALLTCQMPANKVIAWYQPHGFGPTKFLKDDLIHEISNTLRDNDTIIFSEIFYAGGTATKDISANELTEGVKNNGKNAVFIEDRGQITGYIRKHVDKNTTILLMGARDPSLSGFARFVFDEILNYEKNKVILP